MVDGLPNALDEAIQLLDLLRGGGDPGPDFAEAPRRGFRGVHSHEALALGAELAELQQQLLLLNHSAVETSPEGLSLRRVLRRRNLDAKRWRSRLIATPLSSLVF